MGTLSLDCPFCCNEKFETRDSLKYHILSMIDNLMCPACYFRCESMLELAEHLGKECVDAGEEMPVRERNIKLENPDLSSNENNQSKHSEDFFSPKIEAEEATEDNSSGLLESVLLGKEESQLNSNEDTENPLYLCQMCDMNFNSIEEHLAQYHDGEEVILEQAEENPQDEDQNSSTQDSDLEENFEINEAEESDNERIDYFMQDIHNQTTLTEQECLDKDGRAYTRKVVKIDKFWMDKMKAEPMTEKYVLENGKIRKITKAEADSIQDKDSIIQIHQCPKCYLQFPLIDQYKKHICDPTKIKAGKAKFECSHCSTIFANHQSLTSHMKTHLTKDQDGKIKRVVTVGPHTCDVCKTMFPSFKSLRLHRRMHDPIKDKAPEAPVSYSITGPIDQSKSHVRHMFICGICNKTYDKEYEQIHMKSHEIRENYDCSVCNRKFFTKENLEMHCKAHNNVKKFACSYCKKPFTTYEALQEHVANQCQKRQYECQYCGRRFSRPHEKVKHERIHTGEKPHVCQVCGKSFRVSYCLTLHLRTHSGTRPYHCATCGKRFKSHSVYNHHLLTHSDVRAYKCPYCPKAFKTSVQLAGHRNSHTKPFACTECNRPFASLYAVRAHMETHKRENNLKFDCWLCGATYARAFALRDHIKSQHGGAVMDENVLIELETVESADRIENEMAVEMEGENEVQMEEVEGVV